METFVYSQLVPWPWVIKVQTLLFLVSESERTYSKVLKRKLARKRIHCACVNIILKHNTWWLSHSISLNPQKHLKQKIVTLAYESNTVFVFKPTVNFISPRKWHVMSWNIRRMIGDTYININFFGPYGTAGCLMVKSSSSFFYLFRYVYRRTS